jgi:hypothetical protein
MRPSARTILLTIVCAGLLPACAPAVRSGSYTVGGAAAGSPAPAPRAIRIFELTEPACEYEELGTVRGNARFFWHSEDDVFNAMRERAARLGGHAIVNLRARDSYAGSYARGRSVSLSRQIVYTGTVVRFRGQCADPLASPASRPAGGQREG